MLGKLCPLLLLLAGTTACIDHLPSLFLQYSASSWRTLEKK
jgi:hypothetical protein